MAAQKLCGKNESVVENAKPVRRLQSSPLIDACRKISTEGSEENEGCNDVASLCFLLLAQSARPALAPYPSGFTGAIVNDRFLLNAFLGNLKRERNCAVISFWRGCENADL